MRNWNGWGNENSEYAITLGDTALQVLGSLIGSTDPLPEATLDEVIAKVPASRLPAHSLVETDGKARALHARGQSLPA